MDQNSGKESNGDKERTEKDQNCDDGDDEDDNEEEDDDEEEEDEEEVEEETILEEGDATPGDSFSKKSILETLTPCDLRVLVHSEVNPKFRRRAGVKQLQLFKRFWWPSYFIENKVVFLMVKIEVITFKVI